MFIGNERWLSFNENIDKEEVHVRCTHRFGEKIGEISILLFKMYVID